MTFLLRWNIGNKFYEDTFKDIEVLKQFMCFLLEDITLTMMQMSELTE
jgi:hypothetical protein